MSARSNYAAADVTDIVKLHDDNDRPTGFTGPGPYSGSTIQKQIRREQAASRDAGGIPVFQFSRHPASGRTRAWSFLTTRPIRGLPVTILLRNRTTWCILLPLRRVQTSKALIAPLSARKAIAGVSRWFPLEVSGAEKPRRLARYRGPQQRSSAMMLNESGGSPRRFSAVFAATRLHVVSWAETACANLPAVPECLVLVRDGEEASRAAHNRQIAGASPAPATRISASTGPRSCHQVVDLLIPPRKGGRAVMRHVANV